MRSYVFSPVIHFYSSKKKIIKKKTRRELMSISRKIPHIAVNSLALSQACKCCRCNVTAPPHTHTPALPHLPHTPSHTSPTRLSLLLQGKQQRAAGAPCQMCQVMTANGPWIKELQGRRYESGLKKKNPPVTPELWCPHSLFHRLIGNLLTFPSCN